MRGPSLDDLFTLAAPPDADAEAEARAKLGDQLSIEQLLNLGYGAFDHESFASWCNVARQRGLAKICADEPKAALAWCIAAGRDAWTQWRPVLQAAPNHAFARVEKQITAAIDPAALPAALKAARADTSALPVRAAPPPYAGHFYGGLQALLDARLASNPSAMADALSFFCVAPNGRRAAEIAALAR